VAFCGLTLNADRARVRAVIDRATAARIASGQQGVPDEWTEHLTDNPDDARSLLRQKRQAEMLAGLRG
jgi:hypothetical protein